MMMDQWYTKLEQKTRLISGTTQYIESIIKQRQKSPSQVRVVFIRVVMMESRIRQKRLKAGMDMILIATFYYFYSFDMSRFFKQIPRITNMLSPSTDGRRQLMETSPRYTRGISLEQIPQQKSNWEYPQGVQDSKEMKLYPAGTTNSPNRIIPLYFLRISPCFFNVLQIVRNRYASRRKLVQIDDLRTDMNPQNSDDSTLHNIGLICGQKVQLISVIPRELSCIKNMIRAILFLRTFSERMITMLDTEQIREIDRKEQMMTRGAVLSWLTTIILYL